VDGAVALAVPGEHRTVVALLDSRGHVHVYATDRPRLAELRDGQAGPLLDLTHPPCAASRSCHRHCCSIVVLDLNAVTWHCILRVNVVAGRVPDLASDEV